MATNLRRKLKKKKKAIFSMLDDKALGPDGFAMAFLQE